MLTRSNESVECLIEPEMMDFVKVIKMGALKHGKGNWLEESGKKSSHKEMHDSMFHHLAESFSGYKEDQESGLSPLLHLAARALMLYTRQQRGIVHEQDRVF